MYTPIKLDKSRNFRYGMQAISLVEETFGEKIAKVDMENLSMKETAVIIWAGLVHEDTELTPDKVMELVDEHSDVTTVLEAMSKAMEKSFGEAEQAKNLKKVAK